jgi:hypothetical protein
LTIVRSADEEQAILDGIKSLQQSAPNYDGPDPLRGHHVFGGETTCVSLSTKLLSFGHIYLHSRSPKGGWDEAFQQFGDSSKGQITWRPRVGPLKTSDAPYPSAGSTGQEYGHDPRGKSRELDQNATNKQKLFFKDGKRTN